MSNVKLEQHFRALAQLDTQRSELCVAIAETFAVTATSQPAVDLDMPSVATAGTAVVVTELTEAVVAAGGVATIVPLVEKQVAVTAVGVTTQESAGNLSDGYVWENPETLDDEGYPWDKRIHIKSKNQVNSKQKGNKGKCWRIGGKVTEAEVTACRTEWNNSGLNTTTGEVATVLDAEPVIAPVANPVAAVGVVNPVVNPVVAPVTAAAINVGVVTAATPVGVVTAAAAGVPAITPVVTPVVATVDPTIAAAEAKLIEEQEQAKKDAAAAVQRMTNDSGLGVDYADILDVLKHEFKSDGFEQIVPSQHFELKERLEEIESYYIEMLKDIAETLALGGPANKAGIEAAFLTAFTPFKGVSGPCMVLPEDQEAAVAAISATAISWQTAIKAA